MFHPGIQVIALLVVCLSDSFGYTYVHLFFSFSFRVVCWIGVIAGDAPRFTGVRFKTIG